MTPHAESYRAGRFHRTVGRQERDPGDARRNLLEQLQPLARYCSLHANETGDVAARPRQASDEAIADRISNLRENDRDGVRLSQQRPGCRRVLRKNEIRLQPDELLCKSLHQLNIGRRPAIVASDGTALRPAEFLETLAERCDPGASFPVALGIAISTPIRRMRSRCCARAASGQATAALASVQRISRRPMWIAMRPISWLIGFRLENCRSATLIRLI